MGNAELLTQPEVSGSNAMLGCEPLFLTRFSIRLQNYAVV